MPTRVKVVFYWAPAAAWMTAMFAVSNLQSSTIAKISPVSLSSAVAHTIGFGVLSVLLYRLLFADGPAFGRLTWAVVLMLTVAYGLSDELHQHFVPGRVPSWLDVFYDAVGAVGGLAAAELAARTLRAAGFERL